MHFIGYILGSPCGAGGKKLPVNARDVRDTGSITGLARPSGEGDGNSFQYSCLEKSTGQREPEGLQSIGL